MADDKNIDDGCVTVTVDEKFMEAKISLFPPKNGGRPITEDTVKKALSEKSVFKFVDWEKINNAISTNSIVNGLIVAEGKYAEDGEHGSIEYCAPTVSELKPQLDEATGTVDYRELGQIRNVKAGSLVATIKLATKGVAGCDLRGADILPYPGKEAKYTIGTGTVLSADKSKIYAAVDGNLRWDKDRFVVDAVVSINGDVDLSVGNLNFVGDINIRGSVFEGFIVQGRNVTVFGSVTSATVVATGTLEIKAGAIFSNITSEGEMKLNFAENATINAKGALSAKSLVNCRVFCESDVTLQGAKGIIVGGECVSYGNIHSANVGADTYAKTQINLGNTMQLMKAHKERKEQYEKNLANYNKLHSLYENLSEQKKIAPLDTERGNILRQSFRYIMAEKPKLDELKSEIDREQLIIENSRRLTLRVKNKIYPGVSIRIFTSIYDNDNEAGNCTFYLAQNGDVTFRAGD